VVVASEGYPGDSVTGRPLLGAEPSTASDGGPLLCFHAGTRPDAGGSYLTSGGRVATFVGVGDDLAAARSEAYRGVEACALVGGQHRSDIAARELAG
jgi:phosphoribosylamine--glycine ligase